MCRRRSSAPTRPDGGPPCGLIGCRPPARVAARARRADGRTQHDTSPCPPARSTYTATRPRIWSVVHRVIAHVAHRSTRQSSAGSEIHVQASSNVSQRRKCQRWMSGATERFHDGGRVLSSPRPQPELAVDRDRRLRRARQRPGRHHRTHQAGHRTTIAHQHTDRLQGPASGDRRGGRFRTRDSNGVRWWGARGRCGRSMSLRGRSRLDHRRAVICRWRGTMHVNERRRHRHAAGRRAAHRPP